MAENKITSFVFEGKNIRVVTNPAGELAWIAKDVCNILGLSNPTEALRSLDVDEKGRYTELKVDLTKPESGAIPRTYATVTEPGLYVLILKSQKPEAKRFQRYLTHEILPQIRQTGYYVQKGDEERVRDALDKILLDRAMSWESLWDSELPRLLSKIANWKQVERPKVPGMICLDIYNRILGKRVVDEARNRRDAQGVKTIHQLFQEPIRRLVRDKIEAVMAIARISTSYEDFQNKLCTGIGGAMLQIPLFETKCVCGQKVIEGAAFCHRCGRKVGEDAA